MTDEMMQMAVKEKLGKRELYVLMAMQLGYLDIYGIQQFTGLRRNVAEDAAQNVQDLLSKYSFNNTLTTLVVAAQNVQTPPFQLLAHLNTLLVVHGTPGGRELAALKGIYLVAYEYCHRNQAEAMNLLKDAMDLYATDLRGSKYPALYFVTVFKSYLRVLPPKPRDRREWEAFSGKRSRYNPKTKLWEAV